jgi:integrase
LGIGLSLGYYRAASGPGTWYATYYDPQATPKERRERLGYADDYDLADGVQILSWEQAEARARMWAASVKEDPPAPKVAGALKAAKAAYTVDRAWEDYCQDAMIRGVRGLSNMKLVYDASIRSVLGSIEVEKLTYPQIKDWRDQYANTPRRTNLSEKTRAKRERLIATGKLQAPKLTEEEQQDRLRARRETANRVLSNLKAALNYALATERVDCSPVWDRVKPFPKTAKKRERVLEPEERSKLIAACDDAFRPLVLAAMFTGARYGELAKAQVKDFNPRTRTFRIRFGKAKGGYAVRDCHLTDEALAWFQQQTKGRDPEEPMFKRPGVSRTKRAEGSGDGEGWMAYDQVYAMEQAVKRAGIPKITFHELRHTYATDLLMSGCEPIFVMEALGHKSLRMLERNYGHIMRAAHVAAINKHAPKVLG